jgi:hypothetical protein
MDIRKMAGRSYAASVSAADLDAEEALKTLSMQNSPNIIRALDSLISALRDLREDLESGDEASLKERLSRAHIGHKEWLAQRTSANWAETQHEPAEHPSFTERIFGSITGRKAKK